MFNILIDDLADNHKIRNKEIFEKAIRIPWNENAICSDKYLRVTQQFWKDLTKSMQNYPRYEEFKDVFLFDLDQFLDSVKYSMLLHSTDMDDSSEIELYSPYNMQIVMFLDMDLMCSPNFDKKELGKLRPVFLEVQNALHMAHVINTFPREIEELDFSSPAISIGLRDGLIERESVFTNPRETKESLDELIPSLMKRGEYNIQKIEDYADSINSIDIKEFNKRVRKIFNKFLKRPPYWTDSKSSGYNRELINSDNTGGAIKWVRM
jgi:hypothetical protein